MKNTLYYGDNLAVLRDSIASESIDIVYLDPPFNSNASYNVLFKATSGEQSAAQIEAFEDTWHWNESAALAFEEVLTGPNSDASLMLKAMRAALGDNDVMAYLAMMTVRLLELHRVLKPSGSIYLHCDPTASHYLKILMDAIFESQNFRNEIVWQRTTAHSSAKRFAPIHDILLYYQKTSLRKWNAPRLSYEDGYLDKYYKFDDGDGRLYWKADITGSGVRYGDSGKPWRGHNPTNISRHWAIPKSVILDAVGEEQAASMTAQGKLDVLDSLNAIYFPEEGGMPQYKRYREQLKGKGVGDIWTDIDRINPVGRERLGYPTQKPVALLDRIISASSSPGDMVLDPFCGCGTAIHSAQKLGRVWAGIDVTHLAISLVERRLKDAFSGIDYDVIGTPNDIGGARDLAARDKHEFQKWITGKVGAQPYKGGKKGMDRGIDGYLHFRDASQQPQLAIVSVKGGGHKSGDVRDLKGTVEREKAAMGLFLTLNEPTREMEREAVSAGFYETGGMKFPRIQILTATQVLDNRRPQVPFGFTDGFKRAARDKPDTQTKLL